MWCVDKRQLNAACLQYRSCLPDRQSRTTAPVFIKQPVKQPYSGRRRQALFVKQSATGQETPARLHGNFPMDHDGGTNREEQRGQLMTLSPKKKKERNRRKKKKKQKRDTNKQKPTTIKLGVLVLQSFKCNTGYLLLHCFINTCSLLRLEGKMLTSLTLPCEIKKCFGKAKD